MATAAPLRSSTPPGNNQDHLYRLLNLTVDEGTSIVRQIFDEKRLLYKPKLDLNTFLTQERSTIQNNKQIQLYLKDKLFPKSGTPTHSLENFDLTLLVSLLRNISSLGLQGPWKNEPKPGEEKPEDDLRRLQIMRNSLAHIESTKGISEQDFHSKWSDTENVLHRLNKSLNCPDRNLKRRIKECKTKSLDSKGLEQIIDKLQTSINSEIELLKTHVDNHDAQLLKHEKDIQSLKTNQEQQKSSEESSAKQKAEDEYQQTKENLKHDLEQFYQSKHSKIPLSPVFDEHDTPNTQLSDFYLMPVMKDVKIENGQEKKTTIKLSEMFKSESSQEIYITADAGFGKTVFSKYLTVLWCQAHFPDEKHLEEESVNVMHGFDFLFMFLLRESSVKCSIDDLIFNQIVQYMSHSKSYSKAFLQDILERERCLVVLDGLDEWTHPVECKETDKGIPHRNPRKKCTILTTTRMWKLSTIKLGTGKIDKKIELTHLDYDSALELTLRALMKIKEKTNRVELKKDAKELLKKYNDFEQVFVPHQLMFVICLWCNNRIPVGQTKCGLYTSIIEFLLSRAEGTPGQSSQTVGIPQCFENHVHCKKNFTFLKSLGELAFERLLSEENRLVFDSSIAEKCLKEDDFLGLARRTGLITQNKQSELTSQTRTTSFSHKTMQEFFAALYICTCSDKKKDEVQTKVLKCCKSIQDILELSKVYIFISGINAELLSSLSHKLMGEMNNDVITREYRSTAEEEVMRHPLEEIQNMFVSCIKEIPDNKNVNICLSDFFFNKKCYDDNYFSSLQRLAVNNKTNIKSICIGNFVGQSLSKIIDSCKLSDPGIHCQKISCACACTEEEMIRLLSTSVKCLTIGGIRSDDENKDARSCLTDEQCKTFQNSSQLETIHIRKSRVSHMLLNNIMNVKSEKQIVLEELSCSEHDNRSCPGINFDLSQHSELRELFLISQHFTLCDISENESEDAQKYLTDEFHNSSQLETIYIKSATVNHKLLNCIINVKSMKQLTLERVCCVDYGDSCSGINFDLSQQPELRTFRLVSSQPSFTLCDMYENESKDAHKCLADEQCNTFHNSSQLESIEIEHSTVSHKFLNCIIKVKSMKQLILESVYCRNHGNSCPGINFDLSQQPELRTLVLRSMSPPYFTLCDMYENESKDAHKCLADEQCKTLNNSRQLETIYIEKSRLNHKLLNYILNVKSIKQIELWKLSCSEHTYQSCPGFNFDFSQHSELRQFVCREQDRIFTLCDMNGDESLRLHNMRNIELVKLMYVKMSSMFICSLVEIIKQLEHSVRVELWWCTIKPRDKFVNIRGEIWRSESFDVKEDARYDRENSDKRCRENFGDVFMFVTKK